MAKVEEQRRADRVPIRLVTSGADGQTPLTLLNLSTTGLMLNSPRPLRVGDSVQVHLPEIGPTMAEVMWNDADDYGCRFYRAIPESVVVAAEQATRLSRPKPVVQRKELRSVPAPANDTRALVLLIVFLTVVVALFSLMQGFHFE